MLTVIEIDIPSTVMSKSFDCLPIFSAGNELLGVLDDRDGFPGHVVGHIGQVGQHKHRQAE